MNNYGIALCRVSTSKQRLEGSSLSAQEVRINQVARELFNCELIRIWSLDISSRKGKNFKRKDLEEMLVYCKKNQRIKFLFVDEHDRYMRSVDEYYMWKGRFLYEAGVTLVIAAKPELALNPNSASMAIEFFGVWQGEVSNEERITKTTDKMQARVAAGYFPGAVHTCYQTTKVRGLHEPLEPYWSLMQTAMQRILYSDYTLRQALTWLQAQGFTLGAGSILDMNKFKRVLVDPYYGGITKISTWDITGVGLHRVMITKEEHERLKEIVSGVLKKFTRQVHNPNFQMSNITECEECGKLELKAGKFVGYRNHNGKRVEVRKYYERYMCRSCKLGMTKADVHEQMTAKLKPLKTAKPVKDELKQAMRIVWERRNADSGQLMSRLKHKLDTLTQEKDNLVRSIGNNPALAEDIAESVAKIKAEIKDVEKELEQANNTDEDFNAFVDFSLDYVNDLNANWWDLTPDRRERCKQLTFPGGIYVTKNKTVSTPLLSAIYRYESMKKESRKTPIYGDGDLSSEMLAPIYAEFQRWRGLLRQEFQTYLVRTD
jgi:DNA invertase Pin-like site-specific DNA recombinase